MLGSSPSMREVYALIRRVAPTSLGLVLVGESGTGKELTARALHAKSGRTGPFVAVDCGALSGELVDSQLFGHEAGAFTGADRLHRGYFERAAGGTLFLDNITEMPPELQVKLLRVLETGQVFRLGGDRPFVVNVRVIAAANRMLNGALDTQHLRRDLYYRLGSFVITLPPLRDRREDIVLLARAFLDRLNDRFGRTKRLTFEALQRLEAHSWPGNVRELRNVMERAFILADGVIGLDELRFDPPPRTVGLTIDELQRRVILDTLNECRGDKPRAARTLGISLKTLYNRLHAYARDTPETLMGIVRGQRRDA
jgi:DNA-binding NtrC family response regulator